VGTRGPVSQSPVFRRELWLTSTYAGTTKLRVDDMDTEVFRALLRFIYTDSPPETSLLEEATWAEKLLVGADRFELKELKRICEDALCPHIGINSIAATLALAERHRCSVLEAACMEFLYSPGNLEAFLAAGGIEQMKTGCPIALSKLVETKI
jgi:speckle-type POZ protein